MSFKLLSRRGFVLKSVAALMPFGAAKAARAAPTIPVPRSCVVWYSRTGHTRRVADAIAAVSGAKPFEIRLRDPARYSDEYRKATKEVLAEIERGVKPEIDAPDIPVDDFDVFFIGTPTWWHHVSTPVQAWLERVNLNGKIVMPFTTHGGGFEAQTREDFLSFCLGAEVKPTLVIWGRNWGSFDGTVEDWIRDCGLADGR